MRKRLEVDRRQFIQGSVTLLGAQTLAGWARPSGTSGARTTNLKMAAKFRPTQAVWIFVEPTAGFQEQLAGRELARGLRNLGLAGEPTQAKAGGAETAASDFVFSLEVDKQAFKHPEAYEITQKTESGKAPRIRVAGATPQAVLYGVFDFLERQGAFFGLDGEALPAGTSQSVGSSPGRAALGGSAALQSARVEPLAELPEQHCRFQSRGLSHLPRGHDAHAVQHPGHARLFPMQFRLPGQFPLR